MKDINHETVKFLCNEAKKLVNEHDTVKNRPEKEKLRAQLIALKKRIEYEINNIQATLDEENS